MGSAQAKDTRNPTKMLEGEAESRGRGERGSGDQTQTGKKDEKRISGLTQLESGITKHLERKAGESLVKRVWVDHLNVLNKAMFKS